MIICLDIGNSTSTVGLFEEEKLLCLTTLPSSPLPNKEQWESIFAALLEYKKKDKSEVSGVAYSSVVPSSEESIVLACASYFGLEPFSVDVTKDLGIRVNVDHPEEVGADILSDAVAGKTLFEKDTLIVDLGTASKIILLDENGNFEGCTIGAGPGIAKRALNLDTAALPEVEFALPKNVLGKNTVDSINSALLYGLAEEMKGLCNLIEKEYGKPCRRVLTGGYANIIKDLMDGFSFYPDLVLYGVKDIYLRNIKA